MRILETAPKRLARCSKSICWSCCIDLVLTYDIYVYQCWRVCCSDGCGAQQQANKVLPCPTAGARSQLVVPKAGAGVGLMTRTSILTMPVSSHIATKFVLGFVLREQLMILITGMQR